MRTKTPPSLKWLVDRRARLAYDLERDAKEVKTCATRAAGLAAKVEVMKQDLAAIDRALSMHEVRVHPESIALKNTWRSDRLFGHNHLTRNLLLYLRRSQGRWCSTSELMAFVAERGKVPVTPELYPTLRLSVRKRLQNLRVAGRVVRQHGAKTRQEGYWALPNDHNPHAGQMVRLP